MRYRQKRVSEDSFDTLDFSDTKSPHRHLTLNEARQTYYESIMTDRRSAVLTSHRSREGVATAFKPNQDTETSLTKLDDLKLGRGLNVSNEKMGHVLTVYTTKSKGFPATSPFKYLKERESRNKSYINFG
jgi:hypothetical protein